MLQWIRKLFRRRGITIVSCKLEGNEKGLVFPEEFSRSLAELEARGLIEITPMPKDVKQKIRELLSGNPKPNQPDSKGRE